LAEAPHDQRAVTTLSNQTPVGASPSGHPDDWGQAIELRCGRHAPGIGRGLWLRSAGPDGRFNTADDVVAHGAVKASGAAAG
jgi:hypothetical protein